MRSPVAYLVSIVLAGMLLAGCSKGLTESTARAAVDASEDLARRDAFDEMHKYIADNCVLHQKSWKTGGSDSTTKSCAEAVSDSQRLISAATAQGAVHKYTSEIFSVNVQGDKAIATMKTVDTITNNGHVLEVESHQTETLQLRNGQVLITQVDGESEVPTMDGRRIN